MPTLVPTFDAVANFSYSTAANAPGTAGTLLKLGSGTGSRCPVVPFNAVLWPEGAIPLPGNAEVVRVTARSGDELTIERKVEGSVAVNCVAGFQFAADVTAKTLTDLQTAIILASEVWVNIKRFGAKVDGSHDDSANINEAIAALPVANPHGGALFFPHGIAICASTVTMKALTNVMLIGSGGLDMQDEAPVAGAAGGSSQIVFTGVASRAVDMREALGCWLIDIQVYTSNGGMNGFILDCEGARKCGTNRVTLGVGGVAPIAAPQCLYLGGKSDSCTFYSTKFANGAEGVVGRLFSTEHENNAHCFYDCLYLSNQICHILNAGKGWSHYGCTFEQLRNNKGEETVGVGCYKEQAGFEAEALGFYGCWIGDGPVKTGNQIEFRGKGLVIMGGELAVGVTLIKLFKNVSNVVVMGVNFEAATHCMEIETGCSRITYMGNHAAATITGEEIVGRANAKGSIFQTGEGTAWKKFNAALGASPSTEELRLLVNQLREAAISTGAGE